MQATLGNWAKTYERIFTWEFLDFATLIDLALDTNNTIVSLLDIRAHFVPFKCADDLWVYQGFMMSLNHEAGMQGVLKGT